MPRIVSVWIPQWPVHRWRSSERRKPRAAEQRKPSGPPVDLNAPFVLVDGTDAPRITAVNPAAAACRIAVGETLADARARIGALEVRHAEPAADAKALLSLALWATRYTPSVALFRNESGTDGFFLDVTGATHLLGGEERLLADLAGRLESFGLPARVSLAETPGCAWALSHYARTRRPIVAAGEESAALSPLPIEGLRLAPETALTLRRLGLKRIGDLIGKPRAPFAARFEKELLHRLDRALGRSPEPLALLAQPPAYVRTRTLMEPIVSEEAIVIAATRLMRDLAGDLEAAGVGARNLRLTLYRVDGAVEHIDLGLALPTQDADHVARMLRLRLERSDRVTEAGFGFETVRLAATVTERMEPRQHALAAASSEEDARARRCTALFDALRQRLGADSVRQLSPVASHLPERSENVEDAHGERNEPWPAAASPSPRPPLLLPRAEPANVTALLPDGPPLRVLWRGRRHDVRHAEGPERIAAEWWRSGRDAPTRDYYLIEDVTGRRLWLYREGIPGRETAAPRWFVHGMFA